MDLRPKQEAAVKRTGQDVCIVAGPGSGKTRVLVERFCWLVREKGVSPLRILAITFTDKAATEIRKRLAREFAGRPDLREQVERAYVSTVHGFCTRLLKENPIAAGLDPDFRVMDAPESDAELQEAANAALDRLYQERPGPLRELLGAIYVSTRQGGRQPDIAEALTKIYEAMRTAGKTISELRRATAQPPGGLTLAAFLDELLLLLSTAPPKLTPKQKECLGHLREWAERASGLTGTSVSRAHFELLEEYPQDPARGHLSYLKQARDERLPLVASTLIGEYHAPLKGFLLDALALADQLYRQRKRELGALDFSDLEEQAIELLRANPAVLASVRNGFDQILMDELQDTNPLQWRLVNLVRSPDRFFAVGDINQSIFGFRHADPDVFREYRESVAAPGGAIDELDENFRSRGEILAAVEAVVGNAGGVEPRRLEPLRPFGAKPEPSIEVIVGLGEKAVRVESHWIARRIRDLAGSLMIPDGQDGQRPARFRDVAVLVRTLNALAPILEAFQAFGIPYLTESGKTFYETREVRDLVQMLRVIANPADEIALAGVLRSPLAGIGDETLLRLKQRGGLRLDSLEALSCDPDDLASLRRFAVLLDKLRAERDDVSPDRLLLRVIDDCDYEGGLDFRGRANIDKFLCLVRDWRRDGPQSLDALIEDLEWLRSSESEAEAPPDDSSDVVRVMTIHKAKGLEFPIVFLPALHRGIGQTIPPICLSSEGGIGLAWRNPASGEQLEDLIHRFHGEETKLKGVEEEDRLLYVAMTRAEEHLVFSFAETERPQGSHWRMVRDGLRLAGGEPPLPVQLLRTDQLPELAAQPAAAEPQREEPILLARPALVDQHDSAASVTSVDVFASCPRRYYLSRYIGWREGEAAAFDSEPSGGPSAAEFGTLVHALLAGAAADDAPAEAFELVSRFQSSELGKRAARAERLEREVGFVMALEDIVLSGRIDLWFEEAGELVLVDYKTDHVRPEEAAEHAASYAVQLRLYALALERILGRLPDRAFVCLLRPGQAVPVGLDAPLLEEARNLVRAFRQAQSSLQFEMHAGEHCARCRFYGELCLPDIFFSSAFMSRASSSLDRGSASMPL